MRQRLADLMETVDGNEGLLRELIDVFLEDAPRLLDRVHGALVAGNSASLYRSVHTLKGSAGNFGAPAVVACALRLEAGARADDFHAAHIDFETLQKEMQALVADLTAFKDGTCVS
jgi:two-component system, sensor histidine kinase and response regulator